MTGLRWLMEIIGTGVDIVGVIIVVAGALLGAVRYVVHREKSSYRTYRQDLGKAILLGLEFLVAGDIIRTVVVSPTLLNVLILALIVFIRTFLSISLQVELEGRWPWHRGDGE